MVDINKLQNEFSSRYGGKPRVFRAPGRVNLIGEHTDYNDGFVLPCAIGFATYLAARQREDRTIRVASMNFEGGAEFDLDAETSEKTSSWPKYVIGVSLLLEREGFRLSGADLLIDSDVPLGAGLSSSAALEVSTAFALVKLAGHDIDGMQIARTGQKAEHEFAGVKSGIMDQFASVFGKAGHALFLDCRSMKWDSVPVSDAKFIICDTNKKHDLAEGEYNKRREQCEAAAEFFDCDSLRDVSLEMFNARSAEMPELLRKRARHIITENQRVLDAVTALKSSDLESFGRLMNASHESLRDDYEVSSRELDTMVEIARSQPGVMGSRMTGGGFGGCTINLLESDSIDNFKEKVRDEYKQKTGIDADIYDCEIGDGVGEVSGGYTSN